MLTPLCFRIFPSWLKNLFPSGCITPRISRWRAESVDDTTDAIRAVVCIRFAPVFDELTCLQSDTLQ